MQPANSILVFAAVAWSALAVLMAKSDRVIDVISKYPARSVYSDAGSATAINWLDGDRKDFTCLFLRTGDSQLCGIDIGIGDGRQVGIDLSKHTKARLAVRYEGPAEKVRFSFRNAIKDGNSRYPSTYANFIPDSKFHSKKLPIRQGTYVYEIPLDSLEIPDWWKFQSQAPDHEKHNPDRTNVIRMGFDIEDPASVGQHHFHIIGLTLVAPWISVANAGWWLLASFIYFALAGLLSNYVRLRARLQEHNNEMFGLLHKLKEADSESAHFKNLAMYDPLTGLLNRRAALDLVNDFAQRNSLGGTAVVLMDIDHFKRVNDDFGHDTGDEVLESVSRLITQSLREGDAAVRWGGEEILIICPKTRSEGAQKVAEKLRGQITQLRFKVSGLTVSASFGVANIAPGGTFDQALRHADEALYRAKNSGRNQVCLEEIQSPAA